MASLAYHFDTVTVRALDLDELKALTEEDEFFVPSSTFYSSAGILERSTLGTLFETNWERGVLRVKSIYGTEHAVKIDQVYVPAEDGEEKYLIRDAGSRVSSTLFFPGLTPEDAEERLRKAIRAEFGPNVVEVWNMRKGPVRDLRWDVFEIRNEPVSKGRGKNRTTEYVEAERKMLAKGVIDGHQHHYMGAQRAGWHLVTEVHDPEVSSVDMI